MSIAELYLAASQRILSASMDLDSEPDPEPQGVIDSSDNPFEALQGFRDAWASKNHEAPWSSDKFPELDLGDVNWHQYEFPALLRKAPNVTSQILREIISSSIDNVKARIAEEDRLKQEEELRRIAEEESATQEGKGKQPYLPIIIREEAPIVLSPLPDNSSWETIRTEATSPVTVVQDKVVEKRHKFAIGRLFHRSHEKGESSTTGSAHEALLQKLEAKLSSLRLSSTDNKNQDAKVFLTTRLFNRPIHDRVCEVVECVSCLDDFSRKEMVKVPCHSYCRDCFVRLISTVVQNEQQWPPKCCLNQIPFQTILNNVPEKLKKTFHDRSSEWEVPVSERIYCHRPKCGVWVEPRRIDLGKRLGRCERNHLTCTICRGQAHGDEECPQDQDLKMTNLLAEEEGWKHCYACNALVEHKEACQHMTCRCGAQFCYVCGLRWRTCECSQEQLDAIKSAAEDRRYHRQLREDTEASELAEILAQIEEYEIQESLRDEQERQEQARLEEERWQREVKERTREEHQRRKEVEMKYQQLRQMLDELHDLQQVMIESEQGEEAKDLAEKSEEMKKKLLVRQEVSRKELDSQLLVKRREKEDAFAKEFAIRLAREKKLEEEYSTRLGEFWANKPGGEEEVKIAMLPLQQRLDREYQTWQRWRDEQLEAHRTKLEEERTVQDEYMYSARRRMEATCEEKEVEDRRRVLAEKKWIQEVILERERLLGGMEVQEMEGDADSLFSPENEAVLAQAAA
ncbi:putative E3 ubiquitin-protein ligase ARI9-like protein [Cladobotryum mycophilum]|uniref:RBR-type E3 ubiquitin transferase n=1 Tax=Cladobotryum mycophilum TaxID=491253 RepID=A0ABR0S5Y4_9HYPO